ncbi:MAG: Arc family DNA-binding protein [Candidatus Eisenbacteria bacterium]|nr:Arc family DNA-binding protein [Candidatus Eisenbacteria bacterium]
MPTLTIKGIPEKVYRQLKLRATKHRRSLNREVIVCLEQALAAPALDPEEWLAEADRLRKKLALPPLTDDSLRQAKAGGRR